jgi:hypothetical protein
MARTFSFNEFQREHPFGKGSLAKHRTMPRIVCEDGFAMSVQASEYHYCSPRESGEPFYFAVEVGYPTAREDALMEYAESPEEPTSTVYGWVPVEVVDAIVNAHGGAASRAGQGEGR